MDTTCAPAGGRQGKGRVRGEVDKPLGRLLAFGDDVFIIDVWIPLVFFFFILATLLCTVYVVPYDSAIRGNLLCDEYVLYALDYLSRRGGIK